MPMYKYYGLFSHDEDGVSVSFPDLKGCLTCGNDLKEAIEMAQDALGGYLLVSKMDNDDIPAPSPVKTIQVPEGNSLILVEVNTDNLREAV
ncbi:type II toxin-antitoxin system HicB family antitoxin [Priestia aryabhattai]|uniref:type II toxin-antitoxin system HicB family antitoxin n=1 Tax=Priestia aryabhattai TaxID=412384 RepID=UPI003C8C09DA